MEKALQFDVKTLLRKDLGATERYSFEGPVDFEDFKSLSDLKFDVELMRIDDAINVHLSDIELDVERQCTKSLENFAEKIRIPSTERQFFEEAPEVDDPNDIYTINMKHRTVDLTEMLRQEIILHFSPIPVSSSGSEIKWADKDAPSEEELENKPLAKLKDLLK